MNQIPLLLADDHVLMREGLCAQLEQTNHFYVVSTASSVNETIEQTYYYQPRVAIVDIQLADGSGITACQHIVQRSANTGVVLLATYDWDVYLARAWSSGASAFVVKTAAIRELVRVLRQIACGQKLFTSGQMERIWTWQRTVDARLQSLTPRAKQVLHLVSNGYTNPEIAAALLISNKTVECHVSQLLTKLDLESRRDIIAWAEHTRVFVSEDLELKYR
jgi:DNA-binding NarL/FixJ family response regulator